MARMSTGGMAIPPQGPVRRKSGSLKGAEDCLVSGEPASHQTRYRLSILPSACLYRVLAMSACCPTLAVIRSTFQYQVFSPKHKSQPRGLMQLSIRGSL